MSESSSATEPVNEKDKAIFDPAPVDNQILKKDVPVEEIQLPVCDLPLHRPKLSVELQIPSRSPPVCQDGPEEKQHEKIITCHHLSAITIFLASSQPSASTGSFLTLLFFFDLVERFHPSINLQADTPID